MDIIADHLEQVAEQIRDAETHSEPNDVHARRRRKRSDSLLPFRRFDSAERPPQVRFVERECSLQRIALLRGETFEPVETLKQLNLLFQMLSTQAQQAGVATQA